MKEETNFCRKGCSMYRLKRNDYKNISRNAISITYNKVNENIGTDVQRGYEVRKTGYYIRQD